MSDHTKPWSRMQSLSESLGGSKVTKPIFSNSGSAIRILVLVVGGSEWPNF